MCAVTFDYSSWSVRYPEFSSCVSPAQAAAYWLEAGLYCDNTSSSPVADDSVGGTRSVLLGMVTAHIAALCTAPEGDKDASPLVGRVTTASEGSVSVSVQNDYPPGTVQWWQQTRYGASFWAASAQYRMGFYRPGPSPQFNGVRRRGLW